MFVVNAVVVREGVCEDGVHYETKPDDGIILIKVAAAST